MLIAAISFAAPATYAQVSVGLSVRLAPPPLPVYEQPECPVDGYLWQPGYWAYDDADGYYWVPGVWVAPPDPGLLWTPSYWGYDGGYYRYHTGYWGSNVGFYGGINYGFGYPGVGFIGGVWAGRSFRYNTAVFHVNTRVIHNTYVNRTVIHNYGNSRASFNGRGGITRQPSAGERQAMNEHHISPTRTQLAHQQSAGRNPQQHFSANHGRPFTATQARAENHPVNASGFGHNNNSPAAHNAPANHATEPGQRSGFGHSNGAMGAQHAAPQQHMEQHAAPQQHMEQHAQPQRAPMGGGGAPRGFGGGGGMPHGGGGMPHGGGGGMPHGGGGGMPHGGGGAPHGGGHH
jgi:hypothetical protein